MPHLFGPNDFFVGDRVSAVDGSRLGQRGTITPSLLQVTRTNGMEDYRTLTGHILKASSFLGRTAVKWDDDGQTTSYLLRCLRRAPQDR